MFHDDTKSVVVGLMIMSLQITLYKTSM